MCRRAKTFSRRRGKTRKRPETPGFSTGAGRFLQRGEIRDMRRARNGQVLRGLALGGAFPRPSGYIGCSCMGGAEPRPYEVNLVIPRGRGFPVYMRRSNPAPVGVYWVLLYGRGCAPPIRGQSGYSAGTGIPRLYPAERSRARRGAFGAPVGAGLCSALFIRGRAACRPARRRSALRRGRRA